MQSIRRLQPFFRKLVGIGYHIRCHFNRARRAMPPFKYLLPTVREWIVEHLLAENITPNIFDFTIAHQGLNAQLRLGFKANLKLRLFIKRTIIATVIEIHAHLFPYYTKIRPRLLS